VDAIPTGSYVALAHFLDPEDGNPAVGQLRTAFAASPISLGNFRTRDQILGMLDGLELVEPGLVLVSDWWPDGPRIKPMADVQRLAVGAVGRKP
jgi:hypothetical protein